ncbi:hypothetical protein HY837_05160 [archaeon]|nr:hypothetical protein [archaeon]
MKRLFNFCRRNKKTTAFCLGLFYLGFSYLLPDLVNTGRNMQLKDNVKAPRYITLDQVKQDLEKEKKKLGLENVIIHAKFENSSENAYVGRLKGGEGYLLVLARNRNIDALQHELWHVYESEQGLLRESFLYELINPLHPTLSEWRATTYALETSND